VLVAQNFLPGKGDSEYAKKTNFPKQKRKEKKGKEKKKNTRP